MVSTELRGHELKVYKPQVHLDIRKYFFSVRTVDAWNNLPAAFFTLQQCRKFQEKTLLSFQGSGIQISFQLFPPFKSLTLVGGSLS